MEDIVLSRAGVRELERELEKARIACAAADVRLAGVMRRAGDAGDLGEYLDAHREQELLARRVALLEEWLDSASVVEGSRRHDEAELGARAEFEDVDTGERGSFELVSSPESDVSHGKLSIDSPVGRALSGHHAGDTVEVIAPRRRRHLRILAVR